MRIRLVLSAAAARVTGAMAEASAFAHRLAMHEVRRAAVDMFELPPTELAQRRAQALARALRSIYAGVVQAPRLAAAGAPSRAEAERQIDALQGALSLFLLTLLSDLRIVLALRRAKAVPQDLKAHLLVRDPVVTDRVRVVARTTDDPSRAYRIADVPFPPAREALSRPIPENWLAVTDVPRWVAGDDEVVSPRAGRFPCPEDFRNRLRLDDRARGRYGSAIVFQIPKPDEYLPEAPGPWQEVGAAEPVAVLCIDCPATERWRKAENDTLLSVAAPYLATIRVALAALGTVLHRRETDTAAPLQAERPELDR